MSQQRWNSYYENEDGTMQSSTLQKALIQHIRRANYQNAIERKADTPIIEVPKPTDGLCWLMDGDDNMFPLWLNGDCLQKLLIDYFGGI